MTADGPQEHLIAIEAPRLVLEEDAALDQRLDPVDPEQIFGDPQQPVQVAQAALALLDVRLQHIAAVAHALMACIALGQLGVDEGDGAAVHHLGREPALQRLEQIGIAG